MLAPNFAERHMAPVDQAEQVDPRVQALALDFYKRLFSRRPDGQGGFTDDLGGIVAEGFIEDDHPDEVHQEGHERVIGLAGLRRYRAQFDTPAGPPVLAGLETIAVPRSELWTIPGTNEPYDFGAVLRFKVVGPNGKHFYVPLEEHVKFGHNNETGRDEVVRRMYRAVGELGYLGADTDPRNHHELVDRQINHILANDAEMEFAPLRTTYAALYPGVAVAPVPA